MHKTIITGTITRDGVNPNHLFSGTQAENAQDASRKGRLNPKSIMNLQPGAVGHNGAGPKSNGEIQHGR